MLMVAPDRWTIVWFKDGGWSRILPDAEPALRAAVTRLICPEQPWAVGEDQRDSVIDCTTVTGSVLTFPASTVTSWATSTPESRAAEQSIEQMIAREKEAYSTAGAPTPDTVESAQ